MKYVAICAASLCFAAGMAHARDVTTVVGPPSFVEQVPYHGSELATASGIRALRMRVHQAVDRLCAPSDDFMETFNDVACTHPALHEAFAQVDRAVARWRNGTQASVGNITVRAR
jgi:UrcA family protein